MNPESCSTKAQGCYAWVSNCIPSLSSTCSTKIVLIHAQSFLCMLKLIQGKKDSLAWCTSTFQALALLMAVLLLWMQMFSYILSLPYVKCCPTLPPNGLYLLQQVSLGKTCISIEYPQYDWSRISGVIYYPCYVRLLLVTSASGSADFARVYLCCSLLVPTMLVSFVYWTILEIYTVNYINYINNQY